MPIRLSGQGYGRPRSEEEDRNVEITVERIWPFTDDELAAVLTRDESAAPRLTAAAAEQAEGFREALVAAGWSPPPVPED